MIILQKLWWHMTWTFNKEVYTFWLSEYYLFDSRQLLPIDNYCDNHDLVAVHVRCNKMECPPWQNVQQQRSLLKSITE